MVWGGLTIDAGFFIRRRNIFSRGFMRTYGDGPFPMAPLKGTSFILFAKPAGINLETPDSLDKCGGYENKDTSYSATELYI
jgi:hypothetical protein